MDAWFDHAFFAAEIQNGILTPVSRFRADLDAALAEDDGPVEIEINSTGGDVFAGGEMLAAIQDAGDRVSRVVVGGLAASMAANIALMSGRPLAVHTNSLLYFHSASSDVWGGPGAHADEAEMLNRINGPEIAALKARGVPADRVDEGFRDGRNLVLDASEAAHYLGAEIIGATAEAPAKADEQTVSRIANPAADLDRLADYTATLRHVARLAAWTPDAPEAAAADESADENESGTAPAETGSDEQTEIGESCVHGGEGGSTSSGDEAPEAPAADPEPAPEETPPAQEPAPEAEPEKAEDKPADPATDPKPPEAELAARAVADLADEIRKDKAIASLEKQLRAVQSGSSKKIRDLENSLADAKAALAKKEEDFAELRREMETLTASLAAERNARASLVGEVVAPESDIETPATAAPHAARLASLRTVDERLAYLSAHRAELAAERAAK